jgi:hypothetical protein
MDFEQAAHDKIQGESDQNTVYQSNHLSHREIRLLSLHRGLTLDPIECSLLVTFMDNPIKYEALSYTWGDPSIITPINLCGWTFQVTVNLKSALQCLRLENDDRLLWVDAICINQKDVLERNNQVGRMDEIYKQAVEVVAWLGTATDETDSAIDALKVLVNDATLH